MRRETRAAALLLTALFILSCAGCMSGGAERLYALPQLSDEYVQLESLIAGRVRDSGGYAAPVGGSNRQSVQLHDLDGDGVDEAIAFLADATHTPMVCVYRRNDAGDYYLDVIISGEGSAVSRVEYADVNGNGTEEVIIAWQISGELRLLSVYSLTKDEQMALMSTDCAEFFLADLDSDGTEELLILRSGDGGAGRLIRYTFGGGAPASGDAAVSVGADDVLRVRTGYLSDGTAALFMDSRWNEDEYITDVFTAADGTLRNITADDDGHSGVRRRAEAYAEDINADRITEIPASSGDLLRWYALDAEGQRTLKLTTYHDQEDGWYLALPEALAALSPAAETGGDVPGETAVTFLGEIGGEGSTALLTIYRLTGENRLDRAREDGRFLLTQSGTSVYAASLPADGLTTQQEITESFHLIYPEWQTGNLG